MCWVFDSRAPSFTRGDRRRTPAVIVSSRRTSMIARPLRHRFNGGLPWFGPCSTAAAICGSLAGRSRRSNLSGPVAEFLPRWKRLSPRAGRLMLSGFLTSVAVRGILRPGAPGMAIKVSGSTSRPPRSQKHGPVTPTSSARCGSRPSTSATPCPREGRSTSSSTADVCTASPARFTPAIWRTSGLQATKAPACCSSCGCGEVGGRLRNSRALVASNSGSIVGG